jgi:acetylornithine aminotransferase
MNLFKVYPLYDVTPVKAEGAYVWDKKNTKYLDLYGGHGVISVGHSHPKYIADLTAQLNKIGFYSNLIQNPLQLQLAQKLGAISNCEDYNLFLCNSGAEANENALKLASFKTGKSRIISFNNAFHGRTSAAVAVTDNKKIQAPLNLQQKTTFLPLNNMDLVIHEIGKEDVAAVIIEGIQGVGGLDEGTTSFFKQLQEVCFANKVILIVDEIQSGYGRSGKFFAFQHHGIKPDIITTAKGMGNGFPIGGVFIAEKHKASFGMLGTTFGGSHLACTAGISVLEILEKENLIEHVNHISSYLLEALKSVPKIQRVKGRGLMLGLEFDFEVGALRKELIFNKQIFTGGSSNKKLLRILPPLNLTEDQVDIFIDALKETLDG